MNCAASEASLAGLVLPSTTSPQTLSWRHESDRAAMKEFRKQARISRVRRGVSAAAELLEYNAAKGGHRFRELLVTLTYREDVEWRASHIREFLDLCRKRFARRGEPLRYVWVLELTKRGRPHYHLVFWIPASLRFPTPDRAGLWPHGMSQVKRAGGSVWYLIDYLKKANDVESLPRGARIFGCGGLTLDDRAEKRWRLLPRYVRVQFNVGDDVRRCRGGGYMSRLTGEWRPAAQILVRDGAIEILMPDEGGSVQ